MRKIILAAAAAGAALTLAACSEGTQDAAEETVEGAAADTEANADAMGAAVEDAAADTGHAGSASDGDNLCRGGGGESTSADGGATPYCAEAGIGDYDNCRRSRARGELGR